MKGPFTKETVQHGGSQNAIIYRRKQIWYRSDTVVHVAPLPYNMAQAMWVDPETPSTAGLGCRDTGAGYNLGNIGQWPTQSNMSGSSMEAVHNKAYGKFIDKVRSGVALGNNLAEYVQTREMILGLLKGLKNPLRVLAETFDRYAKTKPKNLRRHLVNEVALRDIPGAWLAFHFGVEPLVKDLYSAFQLYCKPFESKTYSASAKGSWDYTLEPHGYSQWWEITHYRAVARLSCRVDISNSLVNAGAELGLINPLSVAWEVLPYSFVVDWFYPVSQLINSMTDLVGLKTTDCYRSWLCNGDSAIRFGKLNPEPWRRMSAAQFQRALEPPVTKMQPFRFPQTVSSIRLGTALAVAIGAFHLQLPYLGKWKLYTE